MKATKFPLMAITLETADLMANALDDDHPDKERWFRIALLLDTCARYNSGQLTQDELGHRFNLVFDDYDEWTVKQVLGD